MGPRKRKYGHLPAARPALEEWAEVLAKAGCEGGMAATFIDYEAETKRIRSERNAEHENLPPLNANDEAQAEDDYKRMCWTM